VVSGKIITFLLAAANWVIFRSAFNDLNTAKFFGAKSSLGCLVPCLGAQLTVCAVV